MLVAAVAAEELASGDLQVFSVLRGSRRPRGLPHLRAAEAVGAGQAPRRGKGGRGPRVAAASPHRPVRAGRVRTHCAWGADVAPGSPLDGDVAWRFTVRTTPGREDGYEDLGDDIYAAMAKEEFPTGNVKTYCTLRPVGDPGRYVMFEHFTAAGSAKHAKGPNVIGPGARQMRTLVPPFERLRYEPVTAIGVAHANYGKTVTPHGVSAGDRGAGPRRDGPRARRPPRDPRLPDPAGPGHGPPRCRADDLKPITQTPWTTTGRSGARRSSSSSA